MKENRNRLGLSQSGLAERSGLSTQYIAMIELSRKFPSPEMLERIAAALEIDTPQLFSMASFSDEAIKRFQTSILSDMEAALKTALTQSVETHTPNLKKMP